MLQKEKEHGPSTKPDAEAAFLASLEGPKLTSLADAAKKPPIEILPPGMASLYGPIPGQKKPGPITSGVPQQPGKPMLLEAPPAAAPPATTAPPLSESSALPPLDPNAPPPSESSGPPPSESSAPTPTDSNASVPAESGPPASSEANPSGPPVPSDSGATPGPTESSAPTTDNQAPTPPLMGDMAPIVPGENVPTSSANGHTVTEALHPVQKTQGMTTPDTAPMIDFS